MYPHQLYTNAYEKLTGTILAGTAASVLGTELELDEALDAGASALLSATGLATDGGNLVTGVEAQRIVDHPGGVLLAVVVGKGTGVGAGQDAMGVDRIGIDGGRAEELLLRGGGGGGTTEESDGKGGELHLLTSDLNRISIATNQQLLVRCDTSCIEKRIPKTARFRRCEQAGRVDFSQ